MTQIETEFNWYTELNKAIEAEPSDERCKDLKNRASSWVTCACGQLCKALPRDGGGMPDDMRLAKFGICFTDCIYNKNWPDARIVLDKIEARSTELLQEINQ